MSNVLPPETVSSKCDGPQVRPSERKSFITALEAGSHVPPGVFETVRHPTTIAFGEGQIGLLAMTQDARESLAAFKEKRKPQWTGK